MANPQYPMPPMQQPMQPMQQMGQMPPPQGMTPRPSVRQGTSRVVPVVVSAGLAVGVFCGLLFGLGTGDEGAIASASTGNNVKAADPDELKPVPMTTTTTAAKPTTPAAGSGSATAPVAAGSGAGSGSAAVAAAGATAGSAATPTVGAGSASGATAGSAQPAAKTAKLIVEIKPDDVADKATITVDKAKLTAGTIDIDLGTADKKTVKLVVKASGYKSVEQKVDVEGDTTVKIELIKRTYAPTTGPRPGGKKDGKSGNDGGGLIDI